MAKREFESTASAQGKDCRYRPVCTCTKMVVKSSRHTLDQECDVEIELVRESNTINRSKESRET